MNMCCKEFNEKYKDYIQEGFRGLEINDDALCTVLDSIFEDLIKIPGFSFAQIKIKFSSSRFYATNVSPHLCNAIELYIDKYLKYK